MTVGGIALLAFGLLVDFPACVARVAVGADVALLAPYLRRWCMDLIEGRAIR
jgi:hypothetical protein